MIEELDTVVLIHAFLNTGWRVAMRGAWCRIYVGAAP